MNRFFVDKIAPDSEFININGSDARHIFKVLRLTPGSKIMVHDGGGCQCLAEIIDVSPSAVKLRPLSFEDAVSEPLTKITLFQGIPKAAKMDYIIQKAVELGVHTIIPVTTERVIVKFDSQKDMQAKTERWNKIAYEACKQAGRGRIIKVNEPISFKEAAVKLKGHESCFMPYEEERDNTLKAYINKNRSVKDIAFIIGPEGGFSKDEAEHLKTLGIEAVTLGKRILRTETASLYLISVLIYECENEER